MFDIKSKIEKIKFGNYHMGHLFLDCMQQCDPDVLCTIDAGTGETETYGSVLARSVHLARCLRALGLQPGDVLTISGTNHLDIRIPNYAALLNGLPFTAIDPSYRYAEVVKVIELTKPKIVFCQQDAYEMYTQVAKELGIGMKIITYDGDETSMAKLMASHEEKPVSEFEPAVFDKNKVFAWLVCTSGTTGKVKVAAIRHFEVALQSTQFLHVFSRGIATFLSLSSVQWISGYCVGFAPFLNWTLVQSSKPNTIEHVIDIINKYKPTTFLPTPTILSLMWKTDVKCDFTCLNSIVYGGASIHKEIIKNLRQRLRSGAWLNEAYGQTEVCGLAVAAEPDTPIGSCGKPLPFFTVKLVEPDTGMEVKEPHKRGEMWIMGPMFTEYYKNREETLLTITEDGWVKTGDLLYRDENQNYYYVERIKMLIRFQSHQISPLEIEEVILSHKGVKEVCVTKIPDVVDSDHAVACVVRQPGCDVTAQEIKDLVADNLSDIKRLRGGVIFMDELFKTPSGKVARGKLGDFVLHAHKEGLLE